MPTYTVLSLMNNPTKNWLYLHDGKPGHVNQLRGLSEAVATKQRNHASVWLDVTTLSASQRLFARGEKISSLQTADVIVAAGHSTHWLALLLGKKWRAHTAVVMRPSWPLSWFDSVIMPKHDACKALTASNIFLTQGAMNTLGRQSHDPRNKGLVLLGGQSKHFNWPSTHVTRQVSAIIESQPELDWTVTDSRRCPAPQLSSIQTACPDTTVKSHNDCPKGWLAEQMCQARSIWVTPDSVSMVYEALSSGAKCGLLELPPRKPNRINTHMQSLIANGKIDSVTSQGIIRAATKPLPRLNEAEKAAQWLHDKLLAATQGEAG